MQELVRKAGDVPSLLPSWKLRNSSNEELAKHIEKLQIPTILGGRPSLLLHALGEEDSLDCDRIVSIFSFADHTCVT